MAIKWKPGKNIADIVLDKILNSKMRSLCQTTVFEIKKDIPIASLDLQKSVSWKKIDRTHYIVFANKEYAFYQDQHVLRHYRHGNTYGNIYQVGTALRNLTAMHRKMKPHTFRRAYQYGYRYLRLWGSLTPSMANYMVSGLLRAIRRKEFNLRVLV